MVLLKNKGIVSLPVILTISIVLASTAIGLGLKGMENAVKVKDEQKSINGFNKLIEKGNKIALGEIGGKEKIRLKLEKNFILVNEKQVKLKRGNETLKIEYLPLKILKNGKEKFTLHGGTYSLSLKKNSDCKDGNVKAFFLEITD